LIPTKIGKYLLFKKIWSLFFGGIVADLRIVIKVIK